MIANDCLIHVQHLPFALGDLSAAVFAHGHVTVFLRPNQQTPRERTFDPFWDAFRLFLGLLFIYN
jgi:hypothetical protein